MKIQSTAFLILMSLFILTFPILTYGASESPQGGEEADAVTRLTLVSNVERLWTEGRKLYEDAFSFSGNAQYQELKKAGQTFNRAKIMIADQLAIRNADDKLLAPQAHYYAGLVRSVTIDGFPLDQKGITVALTYAVAAADDLLSAWLFNGSHI